MAPMAECHMAGYVSAEGAAVGPCNRGSEAPRPIASPPSQNAPIHPPGHFNSTWLPLIQILLIRVSETSSTTLRRQRTGDQHETN